MPVKVYMKRSGGKSSISDTSKKIKVRVPKTLKEEKSTKTNVLDFIKDTVQEGIGNINRTVSGLKSATQKQNVPKTTTSLVSDKKATLQKSSLSPAQEKNEFKIGSPIEGIKNIGASLAKGVVNIPKSLGKTQQLLTNWMDWQESISPVSQALGRKTNITKTLIPTTKEQYDRSLQIENAAIEKIDKSINKNKLGTASKFIGDIVESMPKMALNFIPGIGPAAFGASAMGDYASQAEAQGATEQQQLLYGAVGGIGEMTLNKVLGIIPGIKSILSGKAAASGTLGKQIIKNALSEAVEEGSIDPVMGFAEKFIYNPDKKIVGKDGVFDFGQMSSDAAAGAAMSLMFSALGLPASFNSKKIAESIVKSGKEATYQQLNALATAYKQDIGKQKEQKPVVPINQMGTETSQSKAQADFQEKITAPQLKVSNAIAEELRQKTAAKAQGAQPVSSLQLGKTTSTINPIAGDKTVISAENIQPTQPTKSTVQAQPETQATKYDKVRSWLDTQEVAAKGRVREYFNPSDPTIVKLRSGLPGEIVTDLVTIGAAKIARKTVDFVEWSADMIKEFGDKIKPYLDDIWKKANDALSGGDDVKIVEAKLKTFANEPALKQFTKKFMESQDRLLQEFKKEKEAIRWIAKENRTAALEKLSQKYDAKINKLNKALDDEKYKSFWKNELDKKELRDRITKLRTDKNEQITSMKKEFSEKLKETKKVFTMKKTEAVSKVKEHIRQKAEERRQKAQERAEISKKLEQLRKVDLKHMRPEYKKQIESIFSTFDITAKSHTTKKMSELQKLKEYIEENTDNNIPDYVLKDLDMLSKKTASQITKEQFDNIYNAVIHLAHLEKLKDKLIMKQRYREIKEIVGEAVSNITKGRRNLYSDPTIIDTSKPEYVKNYFKEGYYNHLNPETLSILSDQSSNGVIKEVLFDEMVDGHSKQLKYRHDAYKIFEKFLGGLGNDIRGWSRYFNKKMKTSEYVSVTLPTQVGRLIKKITMTKAERIYIYLASKDADAMRSMEQGGVSFQTNMGREPIKLTKEDIGAIESGMDKKEKQFSDLVEQYFLDYARPLMNETFLDLNGYELIPTRKGYIPIKRNADFLEHDYLKMRNKSAGVGVEGIGLLKERIHSSKPIVADDIFRVLVDHIEKISAYYGMAKPLRNSKMVLNSLDFKNAYRKTGLGEVHKQLDKYIKDVEASSIDMDFLDKLTTGIMGKFDTAVLGGNLWTVLKQFTAYALETNEISAKYLLGAQFSESSMEEIKKYSPILSDRIQGNVSLELGEIGKVANIRKLFGNYKSIGELSTRGIVWADRQIIGKTWNAVKAKIKETNPALKGEELMNKVARQTEEIIRHTNSAATVFDRSAIGRSKSIFNRALTRFTSQTNIMFNSVVRSTLEYNQSNKTMKDKAKMAKKLITILIISNLLEQGVDRLRDKFYGKDDDEEEKWNIPLDLIEGALNQVYFVGKAFSALKSKMEYGKYFGYDITVPPLQIANQFIDFMASVAETVKQVTSEETRWQKYEKGENKNEYKWKVMSKKLIDETLSILFKLKGIPYDNIKKLFEAAKEKLAE